MGVGYVAVDDRVDETLAVGKGIVDEYFDVTTDDFDITVELFTEVDDTFLGVGMMMRSRRPSGAGAPLTTRR